MVQLKLILNRIEMVRQDVKALQKLLLAKPLYLPFSPNLLLKLTLKEIHSLVALKILGGEASAPEIARVLGINRSMVSASLNSLHRLGVLDKTRKGRAAIFKLNVEENNELQQ
jgi:DNA-binding MarR family transcriptional regulator